LPPPPRDYQAGPPQFVEIYGWLAVMNNYLKIALAGLTLVMIIQSVLIVKLYGARQNLERIVIRINDVGRPEVDHVGLDYHPQERETGYFLNQFEQQYYSRMRATVKDNYTRAFYFLDGRLADAAIEANKKTKPIKTFLAAPAEEIDIEVNN